MGVLRPSAGAFCPVLSRTRKQAVSILACLPLLAANIPLLAADAESRPPVSYGEYEIKAAMLYNFAKFVDWPPGALGEAGAPLVIAIVGNDPFGARLETVLRNKVVHGHPIAVRRFVKPEDLKRCHILFVGASDKEHVRRVLQALGRSSILTVGEGDHFTAWGGVIGLILNDNRVHLEVNLDAASRAGLEVSSKLLRLATVRRDFFSQTRN